LRRGFKSLAERNAIAARHAISLPDAAPIDAWVFAQHLNVLVVELGDLGLAQEVVRQLTVADGDSWSAMTLHDKGIYLIVINPSHARTRQQSDLMHELSHIELGHIASRVEVSQSGLLLLSDFSEEQEQEADWYAAALLVPREALVEMRSRHASVAEIASHFGVSEALCAWRLRMTGVDLQMRRARRITG
jgi:Zn-dependent peptidase ImmA (M78 family)